MKYLFLPVLAIMTALAFTASGEEPSAAPPAVPARPSPVYSLQTFKGKKVASITGTVFDKLINSVIPDVTHLYFNDYTSMTEALRLGKVDAVGVDQPVGRMLEGKCPDLMVFPLLVLNDKLGFACRKGDKLAVDAAAAIEEMRRNGTMDDMAKRWLSGRDELMVIPPELEKKNEASKGLLRFAHDNVSMPMGYSGPGGKSLGYDVELALRIGVALNRRVELIPMSFGGLLAALQSGKADMVGGCLSVTEERAKSVDFAGSYYQSGIALLVRRETVAAAPSASISRCGDLAGKPVGTISGTKFDLLLKKKVAAAVPQYFNNYPDQLWAMRSGKIAGFVADEPVARRMTAMHNDLRILPDTLCNDQYAFLFPKSKEELRNEFNRILAEMRSSGMLKAMDKKWFSVDDSIRVMPDYPVDGARGVLTMAADTSSDPFTYLHKGKMLGLEINIARYIAARLGYKLKITTPDISTIIDAVNSGKVDFAACCISITEERKKNMLFSDPHYDGGVVIITVAKGRAAAAAEKKLSRWEGFKLSFERTFVTEDRYKLILDGLWVTILISVLAAVLGTLLGFVVCMARRAAAFWLVLPAKAFIGTLRGTPLLVILMILYYIVFASVNVNPIMIAVLGFSLNFAAYVSEMMRSGIDSVDKGQLEAASALGFSRFQIFWRITFPHAARYVIPVYKGEFISMLKMTSVVGYIAIQDLTKMSDIIRSRTYEAFFPLLSTALIYFFLAYVMTAALGFIEVKIDPKRRRRIIKGVVTK